MHAPLGSELHDILRRTFGYTAFRGQQEAVIGRVMSRPAASKAERRKRFSRARRPVKGLIMASETPHAAGKAGPAPR